MAEVILLGGFASTQRDYDQYAGMVEASSGRETSGYGFNGALNELETVAESIDHRDVITHSGGLLVAHDAMNLGAMPRSVTAIAPSIPSQVRKLVSAGLLISLNNPVQQEQFHEKVQTASAKDEVLSNLTLSIRSVRRLGHFASFSFMESISLQGVSVKAALMSHDGLFDNDKIPRAAIERAMRCGVEVVRVAGVHTSFTGSPVEVLERLEDAPGWLDGAEIADGPTFDSPLMYCVGAFRKKLENRLPLRRAVA